MVIIITYDLRTPKDYHDFFEAIKAQGEAGKWWHYMSSTWLLSTTKTPQEITDAIATHLESQDSLFVCELTPNYQGRLPKAAWDWITSELNTSPLAKLYGGLFGTMPPAPVPGYTPPPELPKKGPLFGDNPFFGEPGKLGKLSDLLGKTPKKPGER
jgi:hypothetical protein